MLRLGDFATIDVEGTAGFITPDDLARGVTSFLQATGAIASVARNTVTPKRDIVSDLLAGNFLSYDYLAAVTVKLNQDSDDGSDLVALVASAFTNVTGNTPSGAYLDGASTKGTPTPATPEPGFLHTLGLGAIASGIQSDLQLALVGVVLIIIVIVALVAYGPNVPKLATVRL